MNEAERNKLTLNVNYGADMHVSPLSKVRNSEVRIVTPQDDLKQNTEQIIIKRYIVKR